MCAAKKQKTIRVFIAVGLNHAFRSYIESLQNDLKALKLPIRYVRPEGIHLTLKFIGEVEENLIGSNCGQYIKRHLAATQPIADGYTYTIQDYPG